MHPIPTYDHSFNLFHTPGIRIRRIASGAPNHTSCCNHTADVKPTLAIPSTASGLFIKKSPGKINNANAIVLIQYVILAAFMASKKKNKYHVVMLPIPSIIPSENGILFSEVLLVFFGSVLHYFLY